MVLRQGEQTTDLDKWTMTTLTVFSTARIWLGGLFAFSSAAGVHWVTLETSKGASEGRAFARGGIMLKSGCNSAGSLRRH